MPQFIIIKRIKADSLAKALKNEKNAVVIEISKEKEEEEPKKVGFDVK